MSESDYVKQQRSLLPPEAQHVPIWDPTIPDDRPSFPVWEYTSVATSSDELESLFGRRFGMALHDGDGITTAASITGYAELAGAEPRQALEFFTAAHRAGDLRWDAETRMHVETRSGWQRDHIHLLRSDR